MSDVTELLIGTSKGEPAALQQLYALLYPEIKRVAREEGMITLRESGLAKARMGATTLREINKVTFVD